MTQRCTGICLVVVAVCLFGTAESLYCTVHLLENGSALYQISAPAEPNWVADWAIDGDNVANDEVFNRSLVVQNTGNSLLSKAYHPNITYIADKTKWPVKVSCDDPASSSLREPLHDANNQSRGLAFNTTDPASSNPHNANKLNWGTILAIVVIAVLVIALLSMLPVGICWRKKKGFPCRCFRKEEEEEQGEAAEGML